jgi:hypothetical protein
MVSTEIESSFKSVERRRLVLAHLELREVPGNCNCETDGTRKLLMVSFFRTTTPAWAAKSTVSSPSSCPLNAKRYTPGANVEYGPIKDQIPRDRAVFCSIKDYGITMTQYVSPLDNVIVGQLD